MKRLFAIPLVLVSISVFAAGCADSGTNPTDAHSEADDHNHEADGHDDHDHAAHDHTAKHGGHLIEIGRNHEYHAELVDDHKTESVTVYMMDSHMEPLTINQPSISLVLTVGNKTESFELAASQSDGTDRFTSNDQHLMEMIEGEDVKGKLRVTIEGKPHTGSFEHHGHGHGEEHDHDEDHDDEDGHDEHDQDDGH